MENNSHGRYGRWSCEQWCIEQVHVHLCRETDLVEAVEVDVRERDRGERGVVAQQSDGWVTVEWSLTFLILEKLVLVKPVLGVGV